MTGAKKLMLYLEVTDINVDYADSGTWRCYGFETFGMTHVELLNNCTVFETDQDGETLRSYDLAGAKDEVYDQIKRIIQKKVNEHLK